MPTQVRPKGDARTIAFSILGVPLNMQYKKTKKQQERDNSIAMRQANSSSRIF